MIHGVSYLLQSLVCHIILARPLSTRKGIRLMRRFEGEVAEAWPAGNDTIHFSFPRAQHIGLVVVQSRSV